MQTSIRLETHAGGPSRSRLDIQDHPVFQALPAVARQRVQAGAQATILASGDPVPDDGALYFIMTGLLGFFPDNKRICVSVIVAGAVHGWDQALDAGAPRATARALLDTLVFRVSAESVIAPLGREWLTRLVASQAPTRLHFLADEAACNASHLVTERLAKWLVRLHCGANGAALRLTQADFAAMLGVQRTSVNAAAGRLQEQKLVRFGRGKVEILNLEGLRQASCGCGETPPRRVHGLQVVPVKPCPEIASWVEASSSEAAPCRLQTEAALV